MLDYVSLCIFAIPVYVIILIVLLWKNLCIKKILFYSLFYFYVIALLSVTLFPVPIQGLSELATYRGGTNNFIPFQSIFDISFNESLDISIKTRQIVGNIILFLPMGLFTSFVFKGKYLQKAMLIGVFSSFCIELFQFLISLFLGFYYKVTDVDDILLNTFGFIIGFFLHKLLQKDFVSKKGG